MTRPHAPAASRRRRAYEGPRGRRPGRRGSGLALAAVIGLTVTGLSPASAAPRDADGRAGTSGASSAVSTAAKDDPRRKGSRGGVPRRDLRGTDSVAPPHDDDHDHEADAETAQRLAEDRALLMASSWDPDLGLLTPREDDSEATAALRASLAEGVERLQQSVRSHQRAVRRSDRAATSLDEARDRLAVAILETAAARRQVEKDRAALMALMAETYRNGSAGSLSLVLGGSGAPGDDRDDRYSGEALFSGLTLLEQMSSSQDDALRAVRRSARELAKVERAEERLRAKAEQRDADARTALREAEEQRSTVLDEVEGLQDLVRQSELRDEVKRRQEAARAEREAAIAEDRSFIDAFLGRAPGSDLALVRAAARLAASSRGGVVFPLPEDAVWIDNDNWGGDGAHWSAGHTGDDFSAPCGTPVLAATRGTVSVRTDQGWSGSWLVVVQGDDGVADSWYAHMQELDVEDGERVKPGQRLGSVGSEGNSTGCHLHFEVHPLGGSIYEDNIDPVQFLRLADAYPTDR